MVFLPQNFWGGTSLTVVNGAPRRRHPLPPFALKRSR